MWPQLLALFYRSISKIRRGQTIRKVEIERFSLTASKPFNEVVTALNAGIGHPDMAEFMRSKIRAAIGSKVDVKKFTVTINVQ